MTLITDEALFERLSPHLPPILETILARQSSKAVLFATEETPADDPMPLPYHFSSQVLLWHTLRRLSVLNVRQPFTTLNLINLSEAIRADILKHMVTPHLGQLLFAYATDLQGHYYYYHDANDLPTLLAPLWGFCQVDDLVWRATMAFAFSLANEGGYYSGPVGGLGSIHTPGAWPLGDVQEFLYARMTRDTARAEAVMDRLATTACWDGSLPEARDPINGAVRSRHWFGWPGAALLAALTAPSWQP
jgi:meiotically up-regulated gene 157 (Mug157) protein